MLSVYDLICKKLFCQTNFGGVYTLNCKNFSHKQFPSLRFVVILDNVQFLDVSKSRLLKETFPISIYFIYYDCKSTFESTCRQL